MTVIADMSGGGHAREVLYQDPYLTDRPGQWHALLVLLLPPPRRILPNYPILLEEDKLLSDMPPTVICLNRGAWVFLGPSLINRRH